MVVADREMVLRITVDHQPDSAWMRTKAWEHVGSMGSLKRRLVVSNHSWTAGGFQEASRWSDDAEPAREAC